jgi:thiamine biosynthesis lipoprotein
VTTELTRAKWQALGTSVELVVNPENTPAARDRHSGADDQHAWATGSDALAQARKILERQLDEVDRVCSRFREDSELMRVNAQAGRTVRVDPRLIDAVELALRAAELTDGDVDPTVGTALLLAGYDRDIQLLDRISSATTEIHRISPTTTEAQRISPATTETHRIPPATKETDTGACSTPAAPNIRVSAIGGWRAVELDRERSTLRIPRGTKLDLGATAKAWAADRAALAIYNTVGCGALVSLGGDISTAGPAPTEQPVGRQVLAGWRIHVTDDHRSGPDSPGQTISIVCGGLATSSTTVRRWRHREQTMHHIIDPATGAPAEEVWRTVSVAASDCADANIAATAAIVRGASAPGWLAGLGLPARLVGRDGEVSTVGAWPTEGHGAMSQPTSTASHRETSTNRPGALSYPEEPA